MAKEIEFYEGKPVFEASDSKKLAAAVKKYDGEVEPPYVVKIPATATKVKDGAFENDKTVGVVLMPDSVTEIGESAFAWCAGLTSIKVSPGNPVYDSREECNAIIETASNKLLYGCSNTIIPNTVTEIGESAFEYCRNLASIVIPDSVTEIGAKAFHECANLTNITIPSSVIEIGEEVFSECEGLTRIYISDSVTKIGKYAFLGCYGLTSINIPDSVTKIGEAAFAGCSNLTNITIPDSVTEIDGSAFSDCDNLKEIHIDDTELLEGVRLNDTVKIIKKTKAVIYSPDPDYDDEDSGELDLGDTAPGWGVNEVVWSPELYLLPRYRKEDSLLGYWNINTNTWQIEPRYACGTLFHNGIAAKKSESGLWTFMDEYGNFLEQLGMSESRPVFSDHRIIVERDGLYGIIDREGYEVYPCVCEFIFPFINGISELNILSEDEGLVKKYIDNNGQILNYSVLEYRPDGYTFVKLEEGILLRKPNGTLIWYPHSIRSSYSEVEYVERYNTWVGDGLFAICDSEGREGVADADGKIIIPTEYEQIGVFSDGLIPVIKDKDVFYVDLNNHPTNLQLLPDNVISTGCLKHGLAVATNKYGLSGIIDQDGAVLIPFKYKMIYEAEPYFWIAQKPNGHSDIIDYALETSKVKGSVMSGSEGLFGVVNIVSENEKEVWFINRDGEMKIKPFKCNHCFSFDEGLAKVYLGDDAEAYMDHWGTIVKQDDDSLEII